MAAYVCSLSPELQKKAEEELNEKPSRRQDDIDAIRKWLIKQPHITARTDDWNILRFLRGCKFSLERTKEKMDMFYTCKTAVPEWFNDRNIENPKMKELLELGVVLPLPGKLPTGETVLLGRFGLYDPTRVSFADVMKFNIMIMEILMFEDESILIRGLTLISDLDKSTFGHMAAFTPTEAKKSATFIQEGYPIRPKAMHYINTPTGFETVFNIFKAFMKDKMKKRLHVHGNNLEGLQAQVPPSVLPQEYGGTNGTVAEITKHWIERVQKRKDWLREEEKFKVNEAKRPGKPKTSVDLFGIEGSFRQLNVD